MNLMELAINSGDPEWDKTAMNFLSERVIGSDVQGDVVRWVSSQVKPDGSINMEACGQFKFDFEERPWIPGDIPNAEFPGDKASDPKPSAAFQAFIDFLVKDLVANGFPDFTWEEKRMEPEEKRANVIGVWDVRPLPLPEK